MSNFINECLSGVVMYDEIDDYIDKWHEGVGNLELHEFLGMTKEEYALFVESEDFLPYIIAAHREGTSIHNILSASMNEMAARSDSQQKSEALERWLKRKGLWE